MTDLKQRLEDSERTDLKASQVTDEVLNTRLVGM